METEHGNLKVLSAKEIDEVLDRGFHAHLGCHHRRETYVVPLTYVRDGDYIYSHSRPGKKIEIMRSNPQVCLQIEEVRSLFHWRSVMIWGRFEELNDLEAAKAMRLLIQRIAAIEKERGLSSLEVEISAILNKSVIFRIRIDKATGRSEG